MRTTSVLVLLVSLALPLSAGTIWFTPPDPDSRTPVTAHFRIFSCPPTSTSVNVGPRIISIAVHAAQACTTPVPRDGYPVSVNLGVLPPGVYDVVQGPDGILRLDNEGFLTVRDAAPPFTIEPNVALHFQTVAIKGLNLPSCDPAPCAKPVVTFGGVPANVVEFQPPGHLIVDAPNHDAGTVDVTVTYAGVTYTATAAFRYFAFDAPTDRAFFEPVLFPTMVSGPGAFGSKWSTEVAMRNENDYTFPVLSLFDVICMPVCDIRPPAHSTRFVTGANAPRGYLLNVPRQAAPNVFFNVLVRDLSRQAEALGTEIPVVRERDFFDRQFTLMNVPSDSRFRVALRFYRIDGGTTIHYRIHPLMSDDTLVDTVATLTQVGSTHMYSAIGDLLTTYPQLAGKGPLRIDIEGSTDIAATWAFVSVTNNTTQHVTIISPQ